MSNKFCDFYDLDKEVFYYLNPQIKKIGNWQGEASKIADYVASWGVVRFWAMSRSRLAENGRILAENNPNAPNNPNEPNNPNAPNNPNEPNNPNDADDRIYNTDGDRRFFTWKVARLVLCKIAGNTLGIQPNLTTEEFKAKLDHPDFNLNQQVLLTELLIEISDTIQFWTMRLKDAQKSGTKP